MTKQFRMILTIVLVMMFAFQGKASSLQRSRASLDLQEMLEISKPAVYELLKRREFHWVMIGGRYKISKRSFDEWLDGSFDTDQAPWDAIESI